MTKLTLDDIADLRAYERERGEFRRRVIELKRRRRVQVGSFVTFVFENRDTIRFQIQEMARVEKIISDEGIDAELRAYNPLIPDPMHLSATMFLELTTDEQLREWLPKLVGIERAVELRVGPEGLVVPAAPDPGHESQLTREETTSSVHYVGWAFDDARAEALAAGPVVLAITHPGYREEVELTGATIDELSADLRGA